MMNMHEVTKLLDGMLTFHTDGQRGCISCTETVRKSPVFSGNIRVSISMKAAALHVSHAAF